MASRNPAHNCWNCGGPGIHHVGSTWICPRCEVLWRPWQTMICSLSDRVVYNGVVLDVVDFTKPDAPSSPA